MEYRKTEGEFPLLSKSAVTLGKFDGIHRGHQKLVERVLEQKEKGLQAVLLAFDLPGKRILAREERRRLLEKMGVDILLECPLTDHFKHMSPETFAREILADALHAACVVVGEDYRFGFQRKGTPGLLKKLGMEYGFQVEVLPKEMAMERKISSSFIREELKRGNMEKVTALLGCDYFVEGEILHGRGLGHRMLLPTTNIRPPEDKLMPPNGVYITESHFERGTYQGITNVGYKPTVGGTFMGVETYLFHCGEDLYGESCQVDFKHFLRPEQRFSSLEALKSQLLRDAKSGEQYFRRKGGNP
ncbi:MAG: bifunctional riboflavin kinase/FAD synthetase [Eubacteriales bacterium]|nr:bifunctional riboflavin kinase/FAD synthetase [Eubacteriales bacterium]